LFDLRNQKDDCREREDNQCKKKDVDKKSFVHTPLVYQMLEYPDMPRTSSTPTEETVAVKKRAPRKRVSKTATESAPVPRTRRPRKVAVPEVTALPEPEPVVTESKGRRAPTQLGEEKQNRKRASRSLLIGMVVGVLLIGAGVGIGISDGGQIDVVAVVNERNEKIQRGEVRDGENTITVPVQNTDVRPNGGLIPADTPPPAPPTEASTTPETTASSTDATTSTATSTDPATDAVGEATATST
jgi:hypothetical protein